MTSLIYTVIAIAIIILFLILFLVYYKKYINPSFSDIKDECIYNRHGCCDDNLTTKLDQQGTNCRWSKKIP